MSWAEATVTYQRPLAIALRCVTNLTFILLVGGCADLRAAAADVEVHRLSDAGRLSEALQVAIGLSEDCIERFGERDPRTIAALFNVGLLRRVEASVRKGGVSTAVSAIG
jgi:hypothetical protein